MILLTVVLLQVLQVGGLELRWVFGIEDVLAEGGKAIRLVQHAPLTLRVDDVVCIPI